MVGLGIKQQLRETSGTDQTKSNIHINLVGNKTQGKGS